MKTTVLPPSRSRDNGALTRPAFTLFELLLVVALMTVLTAVAVPSISAMMRRQQFLDITGQVEQFLTNVRRSAVMTGDAHWVRYSSSERWLAGGVQGQPASLTLQLPEDYEFSYTDVVEKLESEQLGSIGLEGIRLNWSPESYFFPDGTAETLIFRVQNPEKREYEFSVRGLTGQVVLRPVTATEDN